MSIKYSNYEHDIEKNDINFGNQKKLTCDCWKNNTFYCKKHEHKIEKLGNDCINCKNKFNNSNFQVNLQPQSQWPRCISCNKFAYISNHATKVKCQNHGCFCYNCYLEKGIELSWKGIRICTFHDKCLIFEGKAAQKRFNDGDKILIENEAFENFTEELTCEICYTKGNIVQLTNKTICKKCNSTEPKFRIRDEQNDYDDNLSRKKVSEKMMQKEEEQELKPSYDEMQKILREIQNSLSKKDNELFYTKKKLYEYQNEREDLLNRIKILEQQNERMENFLHSKKNIYNYPNEK
ncbi:hypothetical protein C1645_736142 [Glomus cerebriforme]|uniref:Uncharacterized protein n=1 Tax=Glomus cerebriforme TaxID=658196 RepID=A0A397T5T5_9GLOM|nr:hypothetical protein C1645_736142 [Glomus cerebriforme]